jgi:hypothetical protein
MERWELFWPAAVLEPGPGWSGLPPCHSWRGRDNASVGASVTGAADATRVRWRQGGREGERRQPLATATAAAAS